MKISKDGFVRYSFTSTEVLEIVDKSVQFGKRARGSGGSSTTVTLAAAPVFFQTNRGRAEITAIFRDYNEYRGLTVNLEPASGVDLDSLFDQELL